MEAQEFLALFLLSCTLFGFGFICGDSNGRQNTIKQNNRVICQQLFTETNTYLEHIQKDFKSNIAYIKPYVEVK